MKRIAVSCRSCLSRLFCVCSPYCFSSYVSSSFVSFPQCIFIFLCLVVGSPQFSCLQRCSSFYTSISIVFKTSTVDLRNIEMHNVDENVLISAWQHVVKATSNVIMDIVYLLLSIVIERMTARTDRMNATANMVWNFLLTILYKNRH